MWDDDDRVVTLREARELRRRWPIFLSIVAVCFMMSAMSMMVLKSLRNDAPRYLSAAMFLFSVIMSVTVLRRSWQHMPWQEGAFRAELNRSPNQHVVNFATIDSTTV